MSPPAMPQLNADQDDDGSSVTGSASEFSFNRSSSVSTTTTSSTSYSYFSDRVSGNKPHKAQQLHWQAILQLQRDRNGHVDLHHFQLLLRLGGGDIGNVYLCCLRCHPRGLPECYYAMKVVDREALAARKKLVRAETEREILGMLDHPFLPTLYGHFHASHYSCSLIEYCPGGDLHSARLRRPGRRFPISVAKFYVAEILLAIEYLHMMGVIYRDLKPENVLIREDGHIMLSDFDLSLKCDVVPRLFGVVKKEDDDKVATTCVGAISNPVLSCFSLSSASRKKSKKVSSSPEESEGTSSSALEVVVEPATVRSRSFVGTHEYLAPEVIAGSGHGAAVDWWTLGVLLYELIHGKTPFKGHTNEETIINIIKQPLSFPKHSECRSRRGEEELSRANDLISKLLVKNPKKRLGSCKGAVEVKRHEFFNGVINWALIRSVRPPEVPRDWKKKMTSMATVSRSEITSENFDYF